MDNRIRPLKSISSEEEYEDYKKYLDRYLTEYNWFINSKEPEMSVKAKSEQYEIDSDARIALENRARLIKNGEYGTLLERNITAYMLSIEEYEAKKEDISFVNIIRGIVTGDAKTKEHMKRRYMKSRAENMGLQLVEPVNLSIQASDDCVRQMFEDYDFINISKTELSIVPVDTEINEIFSEIREMLSECLKEHGVEIIEGHSNSKDKETPKEKAQEIYNQGPIITHEKTRDIDIGGNEIEK